MSQFTQGHALLIGIGTYQYMTQADVPVTVKDARAIKEILENTNLCGYPAQQIKLLHDTTATRTGLLAALDELAAVTKPESTVLLYYAGHGQYGTDGNYYLTTYDSKLAGGKVVPDTGLRDAELIAKLRAIPARRLLLIFNACHSGAIAPNLSPENFDSAPPPADATDAILSTGEGRIIMTACRPDQKSWIGQGQLTLFTQALVDGLRGQGYVPNRNGYISAFGLYEHLYLTVKETADELGYKQEPELTVLRGVGPFPVALFKGATSLGAFDPQEPLPPDTAVRTVNPERSQRLLRRYEQTLTAINTGSGAIAQGGSTAASERGIAVGGNVTGGTFITGDNNTTQQARGRNIAQAGSGGSATVNDHSRRTAFDQRNQTVLGGQTNIEGGVHTAGGLFNSGIMNTLGAAPTQPTLVAQLRTLQTAIAQAGQGGLIDDDTAIDVDGALRKAINQADKPTPDRQIIQTHLATAKDKLALIPAASGIVNAINAISRALNI